MFRLELVVLDPEDALKHGSPAEVGFDIRTASEAQISTAIRMLNVIITKLEAQMALTKHGVAEKIETEAPSEIAKEAADESWTDQDAAGLAAENEGDTSTS